MPDALASRRSVLLGTASLAAGTAISGGARAQPATAPATLEPVATFTEPRQVTGVAVAPNGRVFVNFPRWEEDVAISVAEVGSDGKLTPYPDEAWNAYRDAEPSQPEQRFVCVQSVTFDPSGHLWVLDPAAPDLGLLVRGGPKAVRIDIAANKVIAVYHFDETVAPQGTYLNDIRFTPNSRTAVITNSGQPGSLIILDVASGKARRVLDGHPSTQFQKGFVTTVDGRQLRRLDGQPPQFSADGIVVDQKGQYAYWQAASGATMYRAPLATLSNPSLPAARQGAAVQTVAKTFAADGYWLARNGAFYLTSDEDNSVKRFEGHEHFSVQVRDSRLLWPDSMAEGPNGEIYITASHIPEMKMWQGPGVTKTELFRFRPKG